MNIKNILSIEPGKPVAWLIFYKYDGEHAVTVYSQREVDYYAKMAYDIIPVFAG